MAKKNTKRKTVGLTCEDCAQRHYYSRKNEQNTPDKLTLQKFCPTTRKVSTQTETKKNLGRNEVKPKKH